MLSSLQGRDDSIKQFSIQPHPTYLSTSKICRVDCVLNCFMLSSVLCYHPYLVSMLFADLLSLHLVTFLMFFVLVHVTFFSSRSMLELKFALCYRAASVPSQASNAVLAEESQAFFKHSPHTNSIIF